MKKLFCLLLLIVFINCGRNIEIPERSKLIAKYIVFDEYISPKLNVCSSDTIPVFNDNKSDCLFRLDTLIFETEFKIGLNDDGHMMTLEDHSVTDNIDFGKFVIKKDTTNWSKANGNDFWIRFSEERNMIIDGTDTLVIERVFSNEKLIFVESKNEKKGRRFIYEYQMRTHSLRQ